MTTAAELGLSGSVDDAVYTVNTDSAVLTLTVPAGAFEEKVKLKAEEIKDGSEEHQTLSDQIHEEGYRADSFTAFDVKFVNEAERKSSHPKKSRSAFSLKRMQLKVRQEKIWKRQKSCISMRMSSQNFLRLKSRIAQRTVKRQQN